MRDLQARPMGFLNTPVPLTGSPTSEPPSASGERTDEEDRDSGSEICSEKQSRTEILYLNGGTQLRRGDHDSPGHGLKDEWCCWETRSSSESVVRLIPQPSK
jgi:hypothetical protein